MYKPNSFELKKETDMNKINYQKCLEETIAKETKAGRVPALFLHSCCAPCSSYVLEYLSNYFKITVFYYNPNITEEAEYKKRVAEQARLISELNTVYPIQLVEGKYDPERFYQITKGMEMLDEGGERCFACYRLRLEEAARLAAEGGFDYVTTTLSISPMKNAEKLNEIGAEVSEKFNIAWLYSDFKKKNGYKRSVELSKEHELYRQSYCGCGFSKAQAIREGRVVLPPNII